MITAKRFSVISLVPLIGIIASCSAKLLTVGIKEGDPSFNNINLNCKNDDMKSHGYQYGDIVNVKLTKDGEEPKTYVLPYVTNYNEAGTYGPCLCDYESRGYTLSIAPGFDIAGLSERDYYKDGKAEITMKSKQGYAKTRKLIQLPAKLTYQECGFDNMKFSNCRDVVAVGNIGDKIRGGAMYRGSSPISDSKNKDRYLAADNFLYYNNINKDISLSLSEEKLEEIYKKRSEETMGKYAEILYHDKNMMTVNLGSDFFRIAIDKNQEILGGDLCAEVFNTIAGFKINEDSFFIHCNEGKDRTGFIVMILEALCGVSLEDLVADYMLTFCNYYNITEVNNKEKYDLMANLTCYRNLYSFMIDAKDGNERFAKLAVEMKDMLNFDAKSKVMKLMEEHKDNDNYLKECAEKYLAGINVSSDNIENIEKFLTRKPNK